ncbi:rhomboid family intramembrane serine protease [Barnesiella propionica]|uniref:rhomboid family protein n=1 Tax=Barnesiella propionica TaxID=2981781 RepID=UPI0011C9D150|nr:rhomboid family intramembrane serine protease [Barnesiella propionica]MCU6769523.1 rhomboid family intramembrane serine protease [Barnesiella propionica]
MEDFFNKLRLRYKQGSVLLKLIYINVAVFIIIRLLAVFLTLFNLDTLNFLSYVEVPSSLSVLLIRPWTLITYMFVHYEILHILFNMLWLYWFGVIFLQYFGEKQMGGLYILGGLAGAVFYIISYNVFPYFSGHQGMMCGASASVIAIVVATAMRVPDYKVNLLFLGAISLKYIAIVTILIDLLSVTSGNGGGHIAHLGGACLGVLFMYRWKNGKDITRPVNRIIDYLATVFKPGTKIKIKHKKNRRPETDMEYRERKNRENNEIDAILDKIKKSGYNALSSDEKKRLFDAGKK